MSEPTETPRMLGGRYEVGELIGRGGMADVYLGHDTRLGRQVAIKMLRTDLARDASFLGRFRREAQSAAGLNHHAIVAVYDSGEDVFIETSGARVDVPYIVMEYVEGHTLREILDQETRLPADEAARITTGILQALEYSHERGIVHRDIKPANVMISRGGSVKVMDFGIARSLTDSSATMTSMSAVVGTARYLSPEQARGETVDARSDLYSAACVLYELLCGRTPFMGEPVSLVYQHIQDAPAPPSAHEPTVPPLFDAVTVHALVKPREERYQNAAEFRADLQAARTGGPVSAAAVASLSAAGGSAAATRPAAAPPTRADHTADIDTAPREHRRRTWLWVLAGLVALGAILGIGSILMNQASKPEQVRVPAVVRTQQSEAEAMVRSAKLQSRVVQVKDDAAEGTVVNQDPASGRQVDQNSVVTLSVSTGPGEFTMPDVRGSSEAAARSALQKAGISKISVDSQREDDTTYEAGQVSSSTPSVGAVVSDTQTVTLRLSSGQVTVPDLTGKTTAEAAIELNAAGLSLKEPADQRVVSDDSLIGRVVRVQDVGKKVDLGTEIELTVGTRPRETVTTTTTPSSGPVPPAPTSPTPKPTPKPTTPTPKPTTPAPSTPAPTTPTPKPPTTPPPA